MLEMLVCLIIVSSMLIITLNKNSTLNLQHYYFLNDYLLKQSQAILYKQDVSAGSGISFNSMGHVNQAKTIYFNGNKVIIHLGNGYASKQ